MPRDDLSSRVRQLERDLKDLRAQNELIIEMLATHTIVQAKRAFDEDVRKRMDELHEKNESNPSDTDQE